MEVTWHRLAQSRVVISGAGAGGIATLRMLLTAGAKAVVLIDSGGIVVSGRESLTSAKSDMAARTNPRRLTGGQSEAVDNRRRGNEQAWGWYATGPTEDLRFAVAEVPGEGDPVVTFSVSGPVDFDVLPEELQGKPRYDIRVEGVKLSPIREPRRQHRLLRHAKIA